MSKRKQAGRMPPGDREKTATRPEITATRPVPLSCGWASVVLSAGKVVSVELERTKERLGKTIGKKFPGAGEVAAEKTGPGRILRDYSEGRILSEKDIAALPVDWDRISPFQLKVLRKTAAIPYGTTATYGKIAAEIGNPAAARAVGAALARNPWPVLVPCHRVVGKDGSLVGFGKGIAAKDALLGFEERNMRRRRVAQ